MLAGTASLRAQVRMPTEPIGFLPLVRWPDGAVMGRALTTDWLEKRAKTDLHFAVNRRAYHPGLIEENPGSLVFPYITAEGTMKVVLRITESTHEPSPFQIVDIDRTYVVGRTEDMSVTPLQRRRMLWFIFDYLGIPWSPWHIGARAGARALGLPMISRRIDLRQDPELKRTIDIGFNDWEYLWGTAAHLGDLLRIDGVDYSDCRGARCPFHWNEGHYKEDLGQLIYDYDEPGWQMLWPHSGFESVIFPGPAGLYDLAEEHLVVDPEGQDAWLDARVDPGQNLVPADLEEPYLLLHDRTVPLLSNPLLTGLAPALVTP